MKDLVTFLKDYEALSKRRYGNLRATGVAVMDIDQALRWVREDPQNLIAWSKVIMAAIEGGLRANVTPFALAQALINEVTGLQAAKFPPPLAQSPDAKKLEGHSHEPGDQ